MDLRKGGSPNSQRMFTGKHGEGGNLKTAAETGRVLSSSLVGECKGFVAKSEGMEWSRPYTHSNWLARHPQPRVSILLVWDQNEVE